MTGERGGYEPDAEGRELLNRVAGRRLIAARWTLETSTDPAVIRAAEDEIRFWAGWGIPSSGRRPVAPSGERIPGGDPAADTEPVDPEPAEIPDELIARSNQPVETDPFGKRKRATLKPPPYRSTQPVVTDPFGEAADYETTESPPLDRHYRGLPRPRRWY
ncbi:MAG: hypothetical protein OXH53_11045 [bacterium]|nr:hypothetical protein [bacterium]